MKISRPFSSYYDQYRDFLLRHAECQVQLTPTWYYMLDYQGSSIETMLKAWSSTWELCRCLRYAAVTAEIVFHCRCHLRYETKYEVLSSFVHGVRILHFSIWFLNVEYKSWGFLMWRDFQVSHAVRWLLRGSIRCWQGDTGSCLIEETLGFLCSWGCWDDLVNPLLSWYIVVSRNPR